MTGWWSDPGAADEVNEQGQVEDSPSVPKFSTQNTYQYNLIKEYLQDTYNVSATMAGSFANDYANQWYEEHGQLPAAYQLMRDDAFNNAASRLVTGADYLPPYFQIGTTFFVNTPDVGPVPVPGIEDPEMRFLDRVQGLSDMGISPDTLNRLGNFVPRLSAEQVLGILNLRAPRASGGGGGGMRAPVFDKATIAESMNDMWRFYLKDEMGDKTDKWVEDFVKEAGAFARKGGSLGLEAWFKGRMRNESRYKLFYTNMPPEIDEDQWIGRYEQLALGKGLRDSSVLRETTRGATQGIGLGGFQAQLERSPEVRAQGGFSSQLAQTVSKLGALGVA